ncbi:hypothetical protein B0A48_06064 [Cryoendolithus antarcticus]|uniref:Uncharacterized protein n=1 Tax=Cryoendolithus antarcticus TaxID=1507870 RepID=A0A1V8TCS8_9PEZI|nr:hypothetical protein B0A48_06064 [Cryoendolithus antarcticus]
MTDSRSTDRGRCLLLELPPELRLIIYSYLDEVTTFTLNHIVVQDKAFLFRLKDATDTLVIQSICRTIRDESWSLLHPAARYALTIDDNAYKATKVKGERKRQTAYEKLDLLSNSTHFAQVRELVVNIRSSGRSGKVMSDWLVTAVHEVVRRIERAETLECLKIIIPFGTRLQEARKHEMVRIYSYFDLHNKLKLKHAVVLDKHAQFRLRTTAKPMGWLAICHTIRGEVLPLLYTVAEHTLFIEAASLRNAKKATERHSRAENGALQLLSTCTHISKAHTLIVRVECSGTCSAKMGKHLLDAIDAGINAIDRSKHLKTLTIDVAGGKWTHQTAACVAFHAMKFRGDITVISNGAHPLSEAIRLWIRYGDIRRALDAM